MHVNAHTHLYSGLAPLGMPAPADPPRTFVEILQRVWWRLDRALDEASLDAAARYYVAHARRAGTVALVDHHESPNFIEGSLDVLADACAGLGMAAVLCYGATERNGGETEARRGLDECRRFVLANRRPGVAGVVGVHASFTVSDETIRRAGRLCRELGTVLHVHLAEDGADVEDARRRGYPGPLQRLLALGALPPGSILVHGVHLSAREARQASDHGCWFVQNPRSNRANRVGYPAALASAERVALGTDGFPSDMLAEAGALAECSAEAGEPAAAVAARPAAGWAMVEERLGLTRVQLEAGATPEPDESAVAAVDAVARDEAARVWARW
jgi:cytosine/adenosine deaminase-related metal-dependent hydrolase